MNFEIHVLPYNILYNFSFSIAILMISFCRYFPVANSPPRISPFVVADCWRGPASHFYLLRKAAAGHALGNPSPSPPAVAGARSRPARKLRSCLQVQSSLTARVAGMLPGIRCWCGPPNKFCPGCSGYRRSQPETRSPRRHNPRLPRQPVQGRSSHLRQRLQIARQRQ